MSRLSDKREIQVLVTLLAQHGLKHVVVSPGSRHAPLSLSFHGHPNIDVFVVPDERAAGYFALGIAQATQVPVAVVCTSGTAALNYGPAIAEAFYQEIPLLVITADRPKEWIDQSDGQTIRQSGVHQLHTLGSFDYLAEAEHRDEQRQNERIINAAWMLADGLVKGPVHINVPLREPLYGLTVETPAQGRPVQHIAHPSIPKKEELHELHEVLRSHKRILVLTGMSAPDAELNRALVKFSEASGALVLTETGSNVNGKHFVPCIDRLLMGMDDALLNDLSPDLLITFGSNIVSKKVKAFIRQAAPDEHWHLDRAGRMLDTFKCLTRAIACEPSALLDALSTGLNGSSYGQQFAAVDRALSSQMHAELERTPWSDLLAFDKVLQKLPAQSILQMGNSSVVRYIQLFDQRPDLVYYGNRGTSGIDGCTATASGMAAVSAKPVTLISGDIAFLYDVNGLWHSGDRSKLKIVLINNGGGNIFKIIEGPSDSDALETLFEARHSLDAKHIAAHFGISYRTAHNAPELETQLDALFAAAECTLLEVFTREVANENVLKELFKTLKATNPFNYGNT